MSECKKEELLAVFRAWDVNRDGFIDKAELSKVLTGCGLLQGDVELILKESDKNQDGKLSYEEFLNWVYNSDTAAFVPLVDMAAEHAAAQSSFSDSFAQEQKVWTEDPASLEEAVQKKRETDGKFCIFVTDLSGTAMEFSMEATSKVADLKTAVAYKKCENISGASKTRDPHLWVRISLLDGDVALDVQKILADLVKDDGTLSLQCLVEEETLDPWLVGHRGVAYRSEDNTGRLQRMRNEANDDKSGYVPSEQMKEMDDIYCQSW
eukprot:gnl/MRDRNA2_/MRDRNA2_106475_c0_seq1.p1 gnl/MRDRNA2_/MRDRNA2_106475_c0~~gnl/MRDRNA2_/MRDRNA2_106475_c0_seq1.p1  ORF type:complete len:265 (+),score=78.92 gnl/MRDRNA2_/MRDRNA2_106475_c0_seq1:83-877(+)